MGALRKSRSSDDEQHARCAGDQAEDYVGDHEHIVHAEEPVRRLAGLALVGAEDGGPNGEADEAFDEICEVHDNGDSTLTMLSSDILEDFFLGSLVLRAIQHAIQIRLSDYPAVKSPSVIALDDGALDDATLLKVLTSDATNKGLQPSKEVIHGIYGLTLRIEEKACLNQLQESCLELLKSLGHPEGKNEQRNLEANDKDGNHSDFSSKRRKV